MPLEMQSLRRVNVTFSCGDANNTFKVISGTGPVAPAAPEKENYEFAGWFNGEIAFDSFKTAYKDITFTARYKDTVLPKKNKPGNLGDRVLAASPALAALAACCCRGRKKIEGLRGL